MFLQCQFAVVDDTVFAQPTANVINAVRAGHASRDRHPMRIEGPEEGRCALGRLDFDIWTNSLIRGVWMSPSRVGDEALP
jgi:hypothetical protein